MRVGLTGNICCGKSKISRTFLELGAKVIDADRISGQYLEKNKEVVAREFPEAVCGKEINKRVLAGIVFNNPKKLARLEALVHPYVFSEIEEFFSQNSGVMVVESSLIFEKGFQNMFDKTAVVYAPYGVCKGRARLRNIDEKDFDARWKTQLDIEEKKNLADFVIDNSANGIEQARQVYYQMEFYNFLLKADISPDLRENIFRELVKRYSESHRAYHNIKHINESLSLLDKIPLKNKLAGFFAVVFHDAIYSPKEKDNEEKSAELADKFLEGYSAGFRKIVRQNILATKHNLKAKSLDSKLIADIDLTILASDAGMYREYVAGVLKEYAPFYSKEQLKEGRRKFIAGMLGRKIFQTEYFKEYEKKAKNNLLKELKSQE